MKYITWLEVPTFSITPSPADFIWPQITCQNRWHTFFRRLKHFCCVRSTAALTIKTMPQRSSVPVDFFGPYREELLQKYGLDRRQISSRELPLSLANSPTRRSLDVGDFDDPVLPVQRQAIFDF